MDRRTARTIKAIREGFSRLLSKKRYSEITVQDILEEADVGRSTFYEHFKTKDELLHAVCADIFAHVFCHALTPEEHHDFSNTNDLNHVITHMFYHFSEDKAELKGILASEGKEIFISDLRTHLNSLVYDYIFKVYNCRKFEESLLVNHLITTLTELTMWWLKRDCAETPERIAEDYFALIVPVLTA